MHIIQPKVEVLPIYGDGTGMLRLIELIGRTCYKSEDKITDTSAPNFVEMLIKRGHEAMIEHATISMKWTCDRGVSHEVVRHRLASYAQESTRYCNYGQRGVAFIEPFFFAPTTEAYKLWEVACHQSEHIYQSLLMLGYTPQEARTVLNNSTKTEIWITLNIREYRHFLTLRAAKAAHLQMRQNAIPILKYLQSKIPLMFDDIPYDRDFPIQHEAQVVELEMP